MRTAIIVALTVVLTVVLTVITIAMTRNTWLIGDLLGLRVEKAAKDLKRETRLEDRRAEAVGAKPLPEKQIEVVIKKKTGHCARLTEAQVDGDEIRVVLVSVCEWPYSTRVVARVVAPDGTILSSNYDLIARIETGTKNEVLIKIIPDPRMAAVHVWAEDNLR